MLMPAANLRLTKPLVLYANLRVQTFGLQASKQDRVLRLNKRASSFVKDAPMLSVAEQGLTKAKRAALALLFRERSACIA